jgi:hypothetical protein
MGNVDIDPDALYDEAMELEYLRDCPMFYPCPDHSEAAQGEHMTAEEIENE